MTIYFYTMQYLIQLLQLFFLILYLEDNPMVALTVSSNFKVVS